MMGVSKSFVRDSPSCSCLTIWFYPAVLHGWSRSARVMPEAPKKAEELMTLQTQLVDSNVLPQSAKPDIQSYAVVMT